MAPGREFIIIDEDEVEIFPEKCPRPVRNCKQCQLEGKLQCRPREEAKEDQENQVEEAPAPLPAADPPEEPPEPEKSQEGDVAQKPLNYNELDPETKKKVTAKLLQELPPVPQKPDQPYQIFHYYEENKEAILRDLEVLGLEEMRKRWGMSHATWKCRRKDGTFQGIAARWGLLGEGEVAGKKSRKKNKGSKGSKKPGRTTHTDGELMKTPYPYVDMTIRDELMFLRGFREATLARGK